MKAKELTSFFNLTDMPFSKEISTKQLKLLPSVEQALSSLLFLVETKGIGILTGKSGTGKSCVLRLLTSRLNTGLYKPLYICHTSVGILEFYTHICTALGLEPGGKRATMFRAIKDHILSLNNVSRIHPILLIDEADKLSNDILCEIRLLTNFAYDSLNALTVLLCGQKNLTQKFGLSILEALANSITVNVNLDTLPKEETFSYIEQRVQEVGNGQSLFTKNAMNLIHQAAGGTLRSINTIANGALVQAFLSNSTQVEKEHVQMAIGR